MHEKLRAWSKKSVAARTSSTILGWRVEECVCVGGWVRGGGSEGERGE